MKRLLQISAVTLAVLMLAGFVVYSQRQAQQQQTAVPMRPPPAPAIAPSNAPPTPVIAPAPEVVAPGSKASAIRSVFESPSKPPLISNTPPPTRVPARETFMFGSKSAPVVPPAMPLIPVVAAPGTNPLPAFRPAPRTNTLRDFRQTP